MKLIHFLMCFAIFFSCKNTPKHPTEASISSLEAEGSINITENESEVKFDPELSIILPYFDYENYDYRTDEDTYKEIIEDINNTSIYNLNDSIAIGCTSDEESLTGLLGHLTLDKKWLCIQFPNEEQGEKLDVDIAHTKSHDFGLLEDSVTVLSTVKKREKDCFYDIAFKGDYTKDDFQLIKYVKIERTSDEAKALVSQLRDILPDKRMRKMFRMSSDTIILEDIFVPDLSYKKIYIMTFDTQKAIISDEDLSNEVIFIIEDGKIRYVNSGHACRVNYFKLKDKDYLFLTSNLYFGYSNYLFDLKSNIEKPIFNIGRAID